MNAVVFRDGHLAVEHRAEPILPRGEALILPLLVGICNTDVEITRG